MLQHVFQTLALAFQTVQQVQIIKHQRDLPSDSLESHALRGAERRSLNRVERPNETLTADERHAEHRVLPKGRGFNAGFIGAKDVKGQARLAALAQRGC